MSKFKIKSQIEELETRLNKWSYEMYKSYNQPHCDYMFVEYDLQYLIDGWTHYLILTQKLDLHFVISYVVEQIDEDYAILEDLQKLHKELENE